MSYVHDGGREGLSPDILRQAAAWFACMADAAVSEEEKRSWQAWLATDPDHARAWRRVEEVMGQLMPLAQTSGAAGSVLGAPRRGRRRMLGALGLLLTAGGAAAMLRLPWREWREEVAMSRATYHTAMGKISTTVLADGSRLWVGSRSIVNLDYTARARRLQLFRGDLMVETATDKQVPSRPFIVETPHGRLRALGTRFAVRADAASSRVDVMEGAIELTPADMSQPVHVVHAGAHAIFDRASLQSVGQASPAREAWTRGILAADRMRLDDLVAELGRWHASVIECDAEVAGLQVVGAYPLQDIDRIFAALSGSLPICILRDEGRIRILAAETGTALPQLPMYDSPPRRIE